VKVHLVYYKQRAMSYNWLEVINWLMLSKTLLC